MSLSLLIQSFWHATDFSLGFILPFPGASSVQPASHVTGSVFSCLLIRYTYTFLFMLIPCYLPHTKHTARRLRRLISSKCFVNPGEFFCVVWIFFPLPMIYMWMLLSFGDKSLYFLFILQSPLNKVRTQRGSKLGNLARLKCLVHCHCCLPRQESYPHSALI